MSKSSANISGRWSYLDEMYCVIASERDTVRVRRKGSWRMLPLDEEGLLA